MTTFKPIFPKGDSNDAYAFSIHWRSYLAALA